MKRALAIFGVIITIVIANILTLLFIRTQQQDSKSSIVDNDALSLLTTKDASGIDTSHLAPGVIPPTNKWFSGIALQKDPMAVFPTPLSFLSKDDSFEIGLPNVSTTAKTIYGPHIAAMTASIMGASSYTITRYDQLSVDITYRSSSADIGTVTITAGSPYVFFTAMRDTQLTVPVITSQAVVKNNSATVSNETASMTIAGFEKAMVGSTDSQITATVPAGSFLSFYSIPKNQSDTLASFAGNRVTETTVNYSKKGDAYQTVIDVKTANNQPTAFGLLPHQKTSDKFSSLTYESIYGPAKIATGSSFHFTTDAITTTASLAVDILNSSDKQLLITTLRRDINATTFTFDDTYYGGKSLYRAAQLLELAHQLHQDDIASSIQQKLRRELDTWLSPSPRTTKSFYYDTKIHGIVGQTATFGSEAFNDHHFHYGYFIYAASILAKYDSEFLDQNKATINLIVADIANYNSDEKLPLRRSFDPYFGHSWASGSSPFSDGNNQESSSEAINAWIGVDLWAKQIANKDLSNEAGWMLSNEVASTAAYWLNFDPSAQPYANGYKQSIVSLNWGGKRDYATFFSSDPKALLGILLIPMSPSTVYQAAYGDTISRQVKEAMPTVDPNAQFSDYILMYSVLGNKTNQLDTAKSLPDTTIDGANSRSYLYAWLMTAR